MTQTSENSRDEKITCARVFHSSRDEPQAQTRGQRERREIIGTHPVDGVESAKGGKERGSPRVIVASKNFVCNVKCDERQQGRKHNEGNLRHTVRHAKERVERQALEVALSTERAARVELETRLTAAQQRISALEDELDQRNKRIAELERGSGRMGGLRG